MIVNSSDTPNTECVGSLYVNILTAGNKTHPSTLDQCVLSGDSAGVLELLIWLLSVVFIGGGVFMYVPLIRESTMICCSIKILFT